MFLATTNIDSGDRLPSRLTDAPGVVNLLTKPRGQHRSGYAAVNMMDSPCCRTPMLVSLSTVLRDTECGVGPEKSRCRSSVTSAGSWPGSSPTPVTTGCNKGRKALCRWELTKDKRSGPRFIQDWLAAAGKSWNQSPTPLGRAGIGVWCKDLESHNPHLRHVLRLC